MQATTYQRTDTECRERLLQILWRTALAAIDLGFPQIAQLLGRLAVGDALIQIVVRGGVVQTVHGLPTGFHHQTISGVDTELYEVLDYDDLRGSLDDGEIAEVYRMADAPMPSSLTEAMDGLESVFRRLEWTS
jgi:hypothetical protein